MARWIWLLPCCVLAAAFSLFLPAEEAEAHPLGNFTINHHSRVEFADEEARVTYVLDFAEIPTFQQKGQLDTNGDGELSSAEADAYLDAELPPLLEGLGLTVGGEKLPLRTTDRSASYRPGQGGLPTLRIETRLVAPLPTDWREQGAGRYSVRNFDERLGWREIVVQAGPGVAIQDSTVPESSASNGLRSYPRDMLFSPLDRRAAKFVVVPGKGSGPELTADRAAQSIGAGAGGGPIDRVVDMISAERLSPALIALSMLAALLWGAAHALTPGHGKAVVAAYLIGARGTARHAGILGLTVTLTHTAGVFALGAVTLYLSRYILPETLYPWLNVVSGLLVVTIGLSLLYGRLRKGAGHTHEHGEHTHVHDEPTHHDHEPVLAGSHASSEHSHGDHGHPHVHHGHGHEHAHDDDHGHSHHEHTHSHGGHTHSHLPPGADGSRITMRSLVALGVSGGLIPCPAALVLLLSAISLDRTGLGIVLVVAFSVGLAVVLTGIGLLMIYARHVFERFSFEARAPSFLPIASAAIVSLVGLVILLGALAQTGIL